MAPPGEIRIGISGWRYRPWRGVFYPAGLPQKDELAFAASRFNTLEINGTFYALQRPESFAAWAAATPPGFLFAVKGPRFITHMLKLRNARTALANFLASGVLCLGDRLGPILWQLPASFRFDPERTEAWLAFLPRDTEAAARLARQHDPSRLAGRAFCEPGPLRPLRHALEVRHPSFVRADFVEMLRRHGVALVCSDTVGWPRLMDVTAGFVYCRLHGVEEFYASGYDPPVIEAWARRILAWAGGGEPADAERAAGPAPDRAPRDVFVYFDNDAKVRAPFDAAALIRRIAELQARAAPA
ncbi:MAG: DUF72 domain-containing protein [Acetobacteraceae bacterium]|nr:DUF72 domain-containing protein [Acetobacteraceae bacterium]